MRSFLLLAILSIYAMPAIAKDYELRFSSGLKTIIPANVFSSDLDQQNLDRDGENKCTGSVESVEVLTYEKLSPFRLQLKIEVISNNCDGRFEKICKYEGEATFNNIDAYVFAKKQPGSCEDYDRH